SGGGRRPASRSGGGGRSVWSPPGADPPCGLGTARGRPRARPRLLRRRCRPRRGPQGLSGLHPPSRVLLQATQSPPFVSGRRRASAVPPVFPPLKRRTLGRSAIGLHPDRLFCRSASERIPARSARPLSPVPVSLWRRVSRYCSPSTRL